MVRGMEETTMLWYDGVRIKKTIAAESEDNKMDYRKLQNGSDVRGTAVAGVEGDPVNLTRDAVVCISRAFIQWLKKKTGKDAVRTAVGRDSRISGPQVAKWACSGFLAEGADVTNFGMASTPAMFMATVFSDWQMDGTVMITASHLPYQKNGLKFFTRGGGLEKGDITEILTLAGTLSDDAPDQELPEVDFMTSYCKYMQDKVKEGVNAEDYDHPLKGYHVVVDAGNGAGGFFASGVLEPLGADTTGSRYLDPDGTFPNHIPNPENEAAMASIQEAVAENKADLGLIFDTDVDRGGAVLADGKELNRNRLIAVMSAILLRDHPGTTIVTDSVTSTGLADFIKEKGGVHRRFKRGYRNVINESIRLNSEGTDSQLAMETSGHGALKENYFMDDGAYLCIKLLIELGRGNRIEDMVASLKEPAESAEVRMHFNISDFRKDGERIIEKITKAAETLPGLSAAPDNHEGIRVNLDKDHGNGWFLLRMSLHEPLMPLNIESDEEGGVKKIASEILPLLQDETMLDISGLAKLAQ